MRVWIDILTPKQVYLFSELSHALESRGHDVFRTTRRYREVNELLALKSLSANEVGKHGGPTLEGKLLAGAQRILELTRLVGRIRPDVAVSFASPEASRTAIGLAIPGITINDSPHSEIVARLTVPLSKILLTPKIIPDKAWLRLGAAPEMIVKYDALDPVAWLRRLTPDPRVLAELKLDPNEPIVVFRAEEAFASYLADRVSQEKSVIIPVINSLLEKSRRRLQVVALPRYTEQAPAIRAAFENHVIVPERVVDGPSLLFFSWVFVGAGGTMTAEAALMGVPTITCFPGSPTLVDEYLAGQGLVWRIVESEKAARKATQVIENFEEVRREQRARAGTTMSSMQDPIDVIVETVEKFTPPRR
jgi:predicted glycosyltransferase